MSASRRNGNGTVRIREGDCLASIASDQGHFPDTIWADGGNGELRAADRDPRTLLPGDRLAVPPRRRREERGAAGRRHRFRRLGELTMLRLRLLGGGEPRAGIECRVNVDGRTECTSTDGDGRIELRIPATAAVATLFVGTNGTTREYVLQLGHLGPCDSVRGAQARLESLGYDVGPVDGLPGPRTQAALRTFQNSVGLPAGGELDDATAAELRRVHGG